MKKIISINDKPQYHELLKALQEAGISYHKNQELNYYTILKDRRIAHNFIDKGVTVELFNEIKNNSPFNENQWADLLEVNIRTIQRYKKFSSPFKHYQSERILEIAEVISRGREVFDNDIENLNIWLNTPSIALGGDKPIDLLNNSYGKDLVMVELNNIEHGLFI